MKKTIITFAVVIIILFGILVFLRFIAGGDEDTWICSSGQWVKHGHPSATKPTGPCGVTDTTTNTSNADTNVNLINGTEMIVNINSATNINENSNTNAQDTNNQPG
jgi:hypothetical protein